MSKAEGEEEEEDGDQSRFHDSIDRLLSSSNTSCSASPSVASEREDDSDSVDPLLLNNYDVWISQPLSVEERRVRLLRHMGLQPVGETVSHSSIGSSRSDINDNDDADSNVRVNCDGISVGSSNGRECGGILRSKSDEDCNSVSNGAVIDDNRSDKTGRSISRNESPASSNASINSQPRGKITVGRNVSFSSILPVSGDGEFEQRLERDGDSGINPLCMIKNLDNGKEFVVDEVREDGMWEKIKEVGTGRQLTMDEFSSEMRVGTSPIVQELMRRQNVEDRNREGLDSNEHGRSGNEPKVKKRSWLKNIKNVASSVAGHRVRRSTSEKETSSEKGGRRSSSATDDSQDVPSQGPEKVRVKQYGKSVKEFTALYKNQEVRAHNGSIRTIKFSLDGKYLASAGEDCVIHIWQASETERKEDFLFDKADDGNFNILFLPNGSPEPSIVSPNLGKLEKKKRRGRTSISRKSVCLEQILVPETVFSLSEKPICSFQGHLDDVLDLSWSKSQLLLSSSMDKTVRLWDLCSKTCLKIFSHSDYVTCIQFNPIDDRYFISGSLDAKVRIWSIPDHRVVDWNDLHEMVTAACYTPDGQGALVGSYKGSCHLYNTSDNKLQQKCQINLQNNKKKSHPKKITGFQFVPGSTSEVLITSADSRVRVINGVDLVHKFKGFHNTNSQISASLTSNGKYAISASEDSCVYVWRHEAESQPNRSKGVTVTQSYEFFNCKDASVAIPWPGMSETWSSQDGSARGQNGNIEDTLTAYHSTTPAEETNGVESSLFSSSPVNRTLSNGANGYFFDRVSVTWPEERLLSITKNRSPRVSVDFTNGLCQNRSAWGMVIVTAGLRGEIRIFQNFGLAVRT